MNIPISDIKSLLITSGLMDSGMSQTEIERLAEDISRSVQGANGRMELSDAIYNSLASYDINLSSGESLFGVAGKIANLISIFPYFE